MTTFKVCSTLSLTKQGCKPIFFTHLGYWSTRTLVNSYPSCRTATLDFFSIWLNLKSQCFCALS